MKITELILREEAITMKDVQDAVGQEKDEQKRAAILSDLARQEKLPGLYDPVSGYFVRNQPPPSGDNGQNNYSISATAREADTQALAAMGLVPSNANTQALGGLIGTGKVSNTKAQNAAAEKTVKDQSAKFGTFGNATTSRGFSGTNQAGKDSGPGDDSAPYKFEPYAEPNSDGELGNRTPDYRMPSSGAANQLGNSSTDQSGSSSTASPNQSGGSSNSSIDPSYGNDRKMKDADSLAGGAAAGAAAGGAAAGGAPAELTTALTQLNNILTKYKVTTESRNNLKRRMISENLHEFSPAEQIRIFTILIENKPEQLNEFIAPLVRGLGRLFRGGSPGARNRAAQAARRAAITAQSTARRTAAAAARNPMRSIGSGLGKLGKAGSVGLGLWGAYEGGKALWDWWNNKPEPEDQPVGEPGGGPVGEPGGGPVGEPGGGPVGEPGGGQGGTVGQAVAAGFISKEDVDIIKKQLPILVRYFGLDTTSNDLKLDIKSTIDGIEDLREKAMSGQLPALAGAATDKPWGKTGDPAQDIGPLPKSVITKDGKTYERPTGWPDKLWRAYLKYLKDKGHLNDTVAMK